MPPSFHLPGLEYAREYPFPTFPTFLLSLSNQITAALLLLLAASPISSSPLPYSAGGGPPPGSRSSSNPAAAAAANRARQGKVISGEYAGDQYQAYASYLKNMQAELSKSPNEGPVVVEVEVPVGPAVRVSHPIRAGPGRYVDLMEHELGMSPNQGPVLVRGTRRIKCCDLHCHAVCFSSPRQQKRSAAYVIDAVEQLPRSGRISTLYM